MTLLLVAALARPVLFAAVMVLAAVAVTLLKTEPRGMRSTSVVADFERQSMSHTMKAA